MPDYDQAGPAEEPATIGELMIAFGNKVDRVEQHKGPVSRVLVDNITADIARDLCPRVTLAANSRCQTVYFRLKLDPDAAVKLARLLVRNARQALKGE